MIKDSLNIIKVGGAIVENEESLQSLLMSLSSLKGRKILVGIIFHQKEGQGRTDFIQRTLREESPGKMLQPCHLTLLAIRCIARMKLIFPFNDADINPAIDFGREYHVIADSDLVDKSIEHTGMG